MVVFHSLKKILSLLRICGNDVCKITHHLDSPLSDVIYYFYIADIFQGLAVVITPWTCCYRLQKPVRLNAKGVKQKMTLWTNQISQSRLGCNLREHRFPCLKLFGFSVASSLAAMSCFSLSLSLLPKRANGTTFCVRYLWFSSFL